MKYHPVAYQVINIGNLVYIETLPDGGCLLNDQDAVDLVAACGEAETALLMLNNGNLPDEFFDLSSGLAGRILLKFGIYSIRVAAIISPDRVQHGKFPEMMIESNRGNDFGVFFERANAEE
jgi:PadR family transcriptional regulator AphA